MIESNRDDDGGDKGHSDGGEGKGDEEEEEELSKQTVHHIVKEMLQPSVCKEHRQRREITPSYDM